MKNVSVVSFSGGRTSAYMVYLIEQMRESGWWDREVGGDVEYIFMDTGAEHPKTYEFIRQVVSEFGINLTCLQGDFDQQVGEGHSYKVVSINDIKHDPVSGPFGQMMKKYGVPTISSAWCTSRMKEETYDKYCNDKYGKDNYVTWLGIRADEPKRLKIGKKDGLRYLAEISDFSKQDVLHFWQQQDFDLGIDEHLGNCVFCFKKTHEKVALAARDEPKLFAQWQSAIDEASDRLNKPILKWEECPFEDYGIRFWIQKIEKGVMYRGRRNAGDVIAMFPYWDDSKLRDYVYRNDKNKSLADESCEPFSCQRSLL